MTPYDPQRHHRRSIRLPGYDYTQPGAYFITIVTHERACLFGEVVDGKMELNAFGEIVREEWFQTAVVRPYVRLDERDFVVMPNHVHGIVWIVDDVVGAQRRDDDDVGAQRRDDNDVGAQRRDDDDVGAQRRDDDDVGAQRRDDDDVGAQRRDDDDVGAQRRCAPTGNAP